MPSNLFLLLPIISGYFFIHFCYWTRYRAQRQAGHRLILESALFGVVFVAVARLVIASIYSSDVGRWLHSTWEHAAGDTPFLGTLCLGFIAGMILPFVVNSVTALSLRILGWESGGSEASSNSRLPGVQRAFEVARWYCLNRALEGSANHLLLLFHKAVSRFWEDHLPVLVTLNSRKVYVGWILEAPSRPEDDYLRILPVMSGHRDSGSLELVFDVEYPLHLYKDFREGGLASDFVVVIPIGEIVSANFYSEDMQEEFYPVLKAESIVREDGSKGQGAGST